MARIKITYNDVMSGIRDNNIRFSDVKKLLEYFGFRCRIKGDHYIFTKDEISEIINLQPLNDKCKKYQVKQLRMIIEKYDLEV